MQEKMIDYKQIFTKEPSRLTKGLEVRSVLIFKIYYHRDQRQLRELRMRRVSVANTSRHLQVLKESHLVVTIEMVILSVIAWLLKRLSS